LKKFISILFCFLLLYSCSANKYRSELEFGNKLAQNGLWQEAYYRWHKYLEKGNNTAAVLNNIAVALEQMGKYEEAAKEYERALKLAPKNSTISSNYKALKKYLKDKKKNEK